VRRRRPELSATDAEDRTLAETSGMPAWRHHPELMRRLAELDRRTRR